MEKALSKGQTSKFEWVEIEGRTVKMPLPVEGNELSRFSFVGREDIIDKTLAAWASLNGGAPLNFRLYGPPGVGKNAIVYELARLLNKELYIMSGNDELDAEDIACAPSMESNGRIVYDASPLFAAMRRGGILFFDEIGKATAAALDPLASVLDDRRTLVSTRAGLTIRARDGFLFCCALNDTEEEGIGLPPFLDERTRPAISVGYPSPELMADILKSRFREEGQWLEVFMAEFSGLSISPRNVIKLIEYAVKLHKLEEEKKGGSAAIPARDAIKKRLYNCLKDMKIEVKDNTSVKKKNPPAKKTQEYDDAFFGFTNKKDSSLH